jgi:hypothetical protein
MEQDIDIVRKDLIASPSPGLLFSRAAAVTAGGEVSVLALGLGIDL